MKIELTDYELLLLVLFTVENRQDAIVMLEEGIIPMLEEHIDAELGETAIKFARMKEMVKLTLVRLYNITDQQFVQLGFKRYDEIIYELKRAEAYYSKNSSEDHYSL